MGGRNSRGVGLALVCLAASLWGTWPLYTRASQVPGPAFAFLVQLAMALPAPFFLTRKALRDRTATLALALVGVFDAANAVLYFSALARGPVVVATLTHYLAPLVVALLAPLVAREPRSPRTLLASPVVLLGLGLVMAPQGGGADGALGTALLGAGSALFYGGLIVTTRVAARAYSPFAITSLHSLFAAAGLLAVYGREALPQAPASPGLLVLGLLLNGLLAANAFNVGLFRLGAQLTGVLTYLEPLVASLLGIAVLGEPAGPLTVVGVLLVLGGGVWVAAEHKTLSQPSTATTD